MSLAACVVLLTQPSSAQQSESPAVEADAQQALIQDGHRWADAGEFCKAWQSYDHAARSQQAPSAAVLFASGRAAHKAGLWDQAVVALQRFLSVSTDENANGLARTWLSEAEGAVARCRMSVDGADASGLVLEGEAVPPPDGNGVPCAHERIALIDEGRTALLNVGWRYVLRGAREAKPVRALDIRVVPQVVPQPAAAAPGGDGAPAGPLELARASCVLDFNSEQPARLAKQSVAAPAADAAPSAHERLAEPPRDPSGTRADSPQGDIPTLSYAAWGGAALAVAGLTAAWIARTVEVDRWNSADCLQAGRSREQSCSEHRDNYRSAQSWMIGTGSAAAVLAATGVIIWWLEAGDEPRASALRCGAELGPSASCALTF